MLKNIVMLSCCLSLVGACSPAPEEHGSSNLVVDVESGTATWLPAGYGAVENVRDEVADFLVLGLRR